MNIEFVRRFNPFSIYSVFYSAFTGKLHVLLKSNITFWSLSLCLALSLSLSLSLVRTYM